jgi:hypothetical protein
VPRLQGSRKAKLNTSPATRRAFVFMPQPQITFVPLAPFFIFLCRVFHFFCGTKQLSGRTVLPVQVCFASSLLQ